MVYCGFEITIDLVREGELSDTYKLELNIYLLKVNYYLCSMTNCSFKILLENPTNFNISFSTTGQFCYIPKQQNTQVDPADFISNHKLIHSKPIRNKPRILVAFQTGEHPTNAESECNVITIKRITTTSPTMDGGVATKRSPLPKAVSSESWANNKL